MYLIRFAFLLKVTDVKLLIDEMRCFGQWGILIRSVGLRMTYTDAILFCFRLKSYPAHYIVA